jgi:hypothetical protein
MSVHKAAPSIETVESGNPGTCTICGQGIMKAPTGTGARWVHWDGYVVKQTPRPSHEGLEMISVTEVEYHHRIRPPGWAYFCTAIEAEDVGDGWTKVLWEMTDPKVPGPYTMFWSTEKVERA